MEEIPKSIFCTIVMRRTIYGIVRNVHTQQMLINGSIRYIKCPKKAKNIIFAWTHIFPVRNWGSRSGAARQRLQIESIYSRPGYAVSPCIKNDSSDMMSARSRLIIMVPTSGIEPETRGFSVPCSTYWAKWAYVELSKWWAFRDLNPGPAGYEPDALTNWAKGPY